MSAAEHHPLLVPISTEAPCGRDLEDSHLLASFDAFRIFGQTTALSDEIEWGAVRDKAFTALAESKDIRLLAFYGAALTRTAGLADLADVLNVAAQWLASYWDQVYPRVDEDAVLRRNALGCFADRMAIVDAVRRAPLVSSRQHGTVTLRDIDIATGLLTPAKGEARPMTQAQIHAALEETPLPDLQQIEQRLSRGLESLARCAEIMRTRGGVEAAPDFDALTAPWSRLTKFLREHLAQRQPASSPAPEESAEHGAASALQGRTIGPIRARAEAVAALEAVSLYFHQFEPSSPIPILIERAARLVSKSFLEVLEDIAPEGMKQAKVLSGTRDK